MAYQVDYYERPNGDKPARGWLVGLESNNRQLAKLVKAKLKKLQEEGLILLRTGMLKHIQGRRALYEIVAGQARVCIYDDTESNTFIVLDGFLKKKQRERQQIQRCCDLLDEYLANKKGRIQ